MVRRIKDGTYIHERPEWPAFQWNSEHISRLLVEVRHRQGRPVGRMEGLGFQLRTEAVLNSLTEEVLKSSEIEGEKLDRDQVRSSIARRLGIDIGGLTPADRDVEGVVEMMLDATLNQRREATLTLPAGSNGFSYVWSACSTTQRRS
jgi:Fic family protein